MPTTVIEPVGIETQRTPYPTARRLPTVIEPVGIETELERELELLESGL